MLKYLFIAAVLAALPTYALFELFEMLHSQSAAIIISSAIGFGLTLLLGYSFKLLAEQKRNQTEKKEQSLPPSEGPLQ
ncbi:hypothetical protein C4J81_00225 [Deltaproteobacteria bacterium Smac51]|nr:hypothetical protein C4J81_00225 [Deltaproteobacteria bacterium Smac51]